MNGSLGFRMSSWVFLLEKMVKGSEGQIWPCGLICGAVPVAKAQRCHSLAAIGVLSLLSAQPADVPQCPLYCSTITQVFEFVFLQCDPFIRL